MCPQDLPQETSTSAAGTATSYQVSGMTCEHCVAAVTAEVGSLDGVAGVAVDLVPGGVSTVTVTSARPLDEGEVRAAVDEAGYELAEVAT